MNKELTELVLSPKFYFSDVGVVNYLAQRGEIKSKSELFGKAFENWVHHELRAYIEYTGRNESLSYWKVHKGPEVDFIIGHMKAAIEVKGSERIHSDHLRGLRELVVDHPEIPHKYVVSMESYSRITDDNILILSVQDFIHKLWNGQLF